MLLLVTAISLLACNIVNADAYVCNKSGHEIRSDQFPQECEGVVTRHLRADGALKETIEPPESKADKLARTARSKQEELEKSIQDSQANADRWLRDRYHGIGEIDDARDAALRDPKAALIVAQATFIRLVNEIKELDKEDEFYAKGNRPRDLVERYKTNDRATKQLINTMHEIEDQIDAIDKKYDQQRKRFAELDSLFDNGRAGK